jgi:hypothetical protein
MNSSGLSAFIELLAIPQGVSHWLYQWRYGFFSAGGISNKILVSLCFFIVNYETRTLAPFPMAQ